jgi:hypothetical protein
MSDAKDIIIKERGKVRRFWIVGLTMLGTMSGNWGYGVPISEFNIKGGLMGIGPDMMMDILHEMRSLGDVLSFLTISKATRELIRHAHFRWAITPLLKELSKAKKMLGDYPLWTQKNLIDEVRAECGLPQREEDDPYPEITKIPNRILLRPRSFAKGLPPKDWLYMLLPEMEGLMKCETYKDFESLLRCYPNLQEVDSIMVRQTEPIQRGMVVFREPICRDPELEINVERTIEDINTHLGGVKVKEVCWSCSGEEEILLLKDFLKCSLAKKISRLELHADLKTTDFCGLIFDGVEELSVDEGLFDKLVHPSEIYDFTTGVWTSTVCTEGTLDPEVTKSFPNLRRVVVFM